MPLRTLGATGLKVSRLGLGLAALGRPGYITIGHGQDLPAGREVTAMEDRAHAVLDAALEAGIRYVDAARSYGRAEAFLASWLRRRQLGRHQVEVGSKWGYRYTAEWRVDAELHEVKEHSLATFERQRGETMQLLGPWLGLYQIHSATLDSGVLERPAVLTALAGFKSQGVAIGLTLSGPRQPQTLELARSVTVEGTPLFDVVQATWNLLEPSAGVALAAAHRAGMGVIVKEALANGRLTERHHDPELLPARERLLALAREMETTVDAVALAAALAQPWADVVLSGAATVAQLGSNLASLELSLDIDDPRLAMAEPGEHYWTLRGTLPWN